MLESITIVCVKHDVAKQCLTKSLNKNVNIII